MELRSIMNDVIMQFDVHEYDARSVKKMNFTIPHCSG